MSVGDWDPECGAAELVSVDDEINREPGILLCYDYEYLGPEEARELGRWLVEAADRVEKRGVDGG